ncbi:MAG: HAMP domain-containing histidine kinase [Blastocatellia bacterium]|nr:HAMP domain-containing histidine kinase [Blastocatellia bacterium]
MRSSLFTKILLWFFLNLLVLGAVLLVFFWWRAPVVGRVFSESSDGMRAVAQLMTAELREKSTPEREAILKRFSEAYQVQFLLFTATGEQVAGEVGSVPPAVLAEITAPPRGRPGGPPPPGARGGPRPPPFPLSEVETSNPKLYWKLVRIPLFEQGEIEERKSVLLAVSPSKSGNGLFFDPKPWALLIVAVFGLSILLWLPFVRSLTTAIQQMTKVTEQIAEEQFEVRVDEQRRDEIGRLGKAINHLATRLSGFIYGQKRFLGDISHELNSPLARMQFALSILEDRVDPQHRSYVTDVQEEVQVMSRLVSELLAYSKAGMKTTDIKLEPVRLRPLVQQVIAREAAHTDGVKNEIDDSLEVLANPELLARALANLIRNAVRYAAGTGAIQIAASPQGQQVKLCVTDNGPGVPDAALDKLFDPFYRLEADRARNTGGAGLGLAIVKACIEACRGTVAAKNRQPSGLEIVITLQSAR